MSFLDALEKLSKRFDELEAQISDPVIAADHLVFTPILKERRSLERKVGSYRRYVELQTYRDQLVADVADESDPEMLELMKVEIAEKEADLVTQLDQCRELFVTDDEDSARNAIVEVRAGTGGDEAALFAGDLLRMYSLYAEAKGWKVEMMEAQPGTVGGFKEVVVNISGDDVFKHLRFESGGHRVQRVPETETAGRIHTSAATVAVLPEVDAVEVDIDEQDLKVDTFRSSGPGGQHANKTSSAIRLTHMPTGIVVSCQDEKSQHKNRAQALRILASRLYEIEKARRDAERSSKRRAQIGSGDRSQRIRTYNFPQNRLTDHRVNLSLYALERIMSGELDEVVQRLWEFDKEQKLEDLED